MIRELPRDLCPENKVTPHLAGSQGHELRRLGEYAVVKGGELYNDLFV